MKLLAILTCYPFPPRIGSTIFAYNSLKHLSNEHEIDLVSFSPAENYFEPANYVKRLVLVPHKKPHGIALWIRFLLNILKGIPPSVSAFKSCEMREKVNELAGSANYDAVLLFDMNAIQFCPPSYYNRLVVHIEDPLSIKASRLMRLPIMPLMERIKMFVVSRIAGIYEKRIFPSVARILLLSGSDIHDLHEKGSYDNLGLAPYGVDRNDQTKILKFEQREKAIIFSGNMFHLPNVDGALFFLNDIFPLVLKQYPRAVLWIVGNAPDARIRTAALKFGKQVVITGRVDDIDDYIKRAAVSICPVRLKIGVQTKILEAMSWGTPVVTTSAGKNGIEGDQGSHLWVEDDSVEFAGKVAELLQGRGWQKLSDGGKWLVENKFSWEESKILLEEYIKAVRSDN
jgi:glycosyltransferase involved in cell wall biosynthesis